MRIAIFACLLAGILTACNSSAPEDKSANIEQSSEDANSDTQPAAAERRIVFFGNSLTAAYGLDPAQGFTAIIQRRIDSLKLSYKVINAGLSGETTAGGNERVEWVLQQPVDIFILELGGNDGLRGINPASSYTNLKSIVGKVRKQYPDARIILAGMEAPPNMGQAFTKEFRGIFSRLAQEEKLELIPFILDGVGGIPSLNQADGIHPNVEGAKIVAENVWKTLGPML